MEEQRYLIKGRTYLAGDPELQDALGGVYDTAERPRCMCVRGGIEMYVAKHRLYVVKRMPDTGHQHHARCASYEAELGQSGLGELIGESIIEHSPESVELRVAFPLARVPGKAFVRRAAQEPAEINAPRHRMSLRAVMHFLFERAGTAKYSRNGQSIYLSNHDVCSESVVHFRAQFMDRVKVECPFVPSSANTIPSRARQPIDPSSRGILRHAALPNRRTDHRQR